MNAQWSDEVKERYTKDQAFYAECSARGIQICQDTATVKLAVRSKPWVGLTIGERNDCLVEADPCECLAKPEAEQLMVEIEEALRRKNT